SDALADVVGHFEIEYRGEHGEDEHQVERSLGKAEVFGVGHCERELRETLSGGLDSVRQQIDAEEVLRRHSELLKPAEDKAGAAADVQNASPAERAAPPLHELLQAAALLANDPRVSGIAGVQLPHDHRARLSVGKDPLDPADLLPGVVTLRRVRRHNFLPFPESL